MERKIYLLQMGDNAPKRRKNCTSSFLCAAGYETNNIYKPFTLEEESQNNKYETALTNLDAYFLPKRNVYKKAREYNFIKGF